ncbi:carbohydrate ABC transporter permease [Mycoplasmatota bacterium]|nr:carbohydrate ABC transporter permease [Mycoplasmatota bacterium]
MVLILVLIFRIDVKFSINKHKQFGTFSLLHPERYENKEFLFLQKPKARKVKRIVFGKLGTDGWLFKIFIYILVLSILFVYLYPLIFMLLTSLQSMSDLRNPGVNLIPSSLYWDNFAKSLEVLDYFNTLKSSFFISVVPSILLVFSCNLVGYGLARFNFKGKNIVFALILMTFIVPSQVLTIPTYLMLKKIGLLGNVLAIILPATFAQGLKHSIFILIAYQFYKSIPKVLDEAAEIDGASPLKIFLRIALPLSVPALLVSFLFSFVWYWNETSTISQYLENYKTLPIQLSKFAATFEKLYPMSDYVDQANRSIKMAGTLLTILPVLGVYFILQRWFVEGIDRTGITGE